MTNRIHFWARRMRGVALRAIVCAGVMLSIFTPCAMASEPVADAVPAAARAQRICLRGPMNAPIPFHGALNYDTAGAGAGAMMYPAPGLAGFLAAVATHAVIGSVVRDSEKQKMRDAADQVLLPYREALNNYTHQELMLASLVSMRLQGDKRVETASLPAAPGETVIDSVPAYYLTQDQRALILEHALSIRIDGAAKPYEKIIRVISPAQGEKTGVDGWFNQNDNMLRQVSARMYAQSLDIALNDMKAAGENTDPFKTVRYSEGGTERMERAQVVSEECGQLVLRTLRGNLISVPRKSAAVEAGCPGSSR